MKGLQSNWLQELLAEHQPPCVSIYQPVNRAQPPAHEDSLRFRDQVDEVERTLLKAHTRVEAMEIVGRLRAIEGDAGFWQGGRRDGVAVFVSKDFQQIIELQQNTGDLVVVGDSFHVKPLVRVLQSGDRYQVLCLSQKNVTLYEGSRYGLFPVELKNVPRNVYEVSGMRLGSNVDSAQDLAQAERQWSEGPGSVVDPVHIDQFMRAVDKGVWENYSRSGKLPLILCAVEEWHDAFHKVSKNQYLMDEGIKLSPVHLPVERLREEAWRIMEPAYQADLQKLSSDFREAKAHQKGSDEVVQVAEAASVGRVGTLLVQENQHIPGKLLRHSGLIEPAEKSDAHPDDVLDDLAEMVLRMDGKVLVLPPENMPTNTGVAAIFRY